MTKLNDLMTEMTAFLASCGVEMADIAVLQPADPFLDTAGEDLRSRIYLTSNETGDSLCLRPEFTIPVCRNHIASRADTPRRYGYAGEVFRQRRDAGNEFYQAGIEDLGDSKTAEADARVLADALALLNSVLGARAMAVSIGDQAVFEAVLAALGLPRGWQKRLARAFGLPEQMKAALDALSSPPKVSTLPGELAALVEAGDFPAVAEHVMEQMEKAGLPAHAGRTAEEIARRLLEKAALEKVRLSGEHIEALRTFLDIHVPLTDAGSVLQEFASNAGIVIDQAVANFEARAAAISRAGINMDSVSYDAAFGRPLDYYTGLVFEIRSEMTGATLAGGGRYDRLLTLLGAKEPIPGVGFSVWLDRIAAERGAAS